MVVIPSFIIASGTKTSEVSSFTFYLVGDAGRTLPFGVEEVHQPRLQRSQLPVQLGRYLNEEIVFPLQQRTLFKRHVCRSGYKKIA